MRRVLDTNIAVVRSRGIAKSDFDLIIASTALEADAVLVTDDTVRPRWP